MGEARARLFEPLALGPITLKNRVVMAPMTTLFDLEGGERAAAFYAERARGGAAMITVNLPALYPGTTGPPAGTSAEPFPGGRMLAVNNDVHVPRLRLLTDAIHRNGALACAQLSTHGLWARGGPGTRAEAVSPSGIVLEGPQYRPDLDHLTLTPAGRPATIDDLRHISDQVSAAAHRAVSAGFDAVQIAAHSGSLLSRFLSPLTNQRTDAYGGALVNRARLVHQVISAVRYVGPGVAVLVRINGDDLLPGGMRVAEYQALVALLEHAGADAIDVSPGWLESRTPLHQMDVPHGAFAHVAAAIRYAARVPVSAGGRIVSPALAERLIEDGSADFVALGTPLLADPDWAQKAQEGRPESIRLCTGCCHCWSDLAGHHRPIACSINARAGREHLPAPARAAHPLRVTVVGGGPGGLEAARVAAGRGHRVTLIEREQALGGHLRQLARVPAKAGWRTFVDYLSRALQDLGVRVVVGVEATADDVLRERPDVVVLATGSVPTRPDIQGVTLPLVTTVDEILGDTSQPGPRVLVIGANAEGCDAAEFLAARGHHVTICERTAALAGDVDFWNRWVVLDRLARSGIRTMTNTRIVEIVPSGARALRESGQPEHIGADTVVCAAGRRAHAPLASDLQGRVARILAIDDTGDALRVRAAVRAGSQAAEAV